jgi:hypothetical protein
MRRGRAGWRRACRTTKLLHSSLQGRGVVQKIGLSVVDFLTERCPRITKKIWACPGEIEETLLGELRVEQDREKRSF